MAQTIKLKRSASSGAIPTTSSLALGEVAINTYDGKMYIKKDVGGTETIVQVGGNTTSVASASYLEAGMIEYEYAASSNQTTFSGSDSNSATLSYTANSILVFLNGVFQDDGVDYTATNGTSVVFSSALTANDEVRIVAFTNVTSTNALNNPTKLDAISTVNTQAAYSLTVGSSAYTPSSQNALIVSLNGITQEPGDSFTISGSTITFSPALVTGDVIDYIVDMGRTVTIGEYSGDLAVGGDLTVGGELEVAGDIIGDLRGATLFKAKAGEALSKGSVVYISGISGNTTVVSKADANDAAKMPSFGVAAEAVSANNPVDVYTFGVLSGIDTSSYSEGDELFVSNTAGVLTSTPPAGETSKLQKIAKVTRSHGSAGSIFIMGAGRSNAVPNLDDGDIFIGNSSNQAVTAALDTSIVPESGNLYYTNARADARIALQVGANLDLSSKDTDDLSEGSTNQYYTDARARGAISVTDAGGDGSLAYNSSTGVITYTGPSATEVRAHFSAGTGVAISSGQISIGQPVATTSDVTFNDVTVSGDLTVNGTTTTLNTATLDVEDLNITVGSGATTSTATDGAGLTFGAWSSGTIPTFIWDHANTRFAANYDIASDIVGNASTATALETARTINGTSFDGTANISFDSDAVSEGSTNLYFTDARADARITAASIDDLSDVDTTGVTSGSVLKWGGSAWVVGTDSPGATVDDATALAIALG